MRFHGDYIFSTKNLLEIWAPRVPAEYVLFGTWTHIASTNTLNLSYLHLGLLGEGPILWYDDFLLWEPLPHNNKPNDSHRHHNGKHNDISNTSTVSPKI